MSSDDVEQLYTGQLDMGAFASEVIEFDSAWGSQHAACCRTSPPTFSTAPSHRARFDGINGVRLANAIYLSSWTGHGVPLDFDDDLYVSELNQRIREEGKFPERRHSVHVPVSSWPPPRQNLSTSLTRTCD